MIVEFLLVVNLYGVDVGQRAYPYPEACYAYGQQWIDARSPYQFMGASFRCIPVQAYEEVPVEPVYEEYVEQPLYENYCEGECKPGHG